MHTTTATITFELEVTVEAGIDQSGFDVVSVRAVTGYDGTRKTWIMSETFKPEELAKLVEQHFWTDAMTAIDWTVGEDRAAYLEGVADLAYERRQEAF